MININNISMVNLMGSAVICLCGINLAYSCPFEEGGADETMKLASYVMSNSGKDVLLSASVGIIAHYTKGEAMSYGLSKNIDGKIVDSQKFLSDKSLLELKKLLSNDELFEPVYGDGKRMNLDMNQGYELTNGYGFIRFYFTEDFLYGKFFSSSGESSKIWKCSDKLRKELKAIFERYK